MQADLPLDPLRALLPKDLPFTPGMARAVGVDRAALERMLRHDVVRRIFKGVYVDAHVVDDTALRARALAMVVPRGRVVHARSAAWLYAVPVARDRQRVETVPAKGLPERDTTVLEGVRVTTPLRTAIDLARTLGPDRGLATLDAFLHAGLVRHRELVAELPRFARHAGIRAARARVARADGRAATEAESVLRQRWLDARLPTPIPRLQVGETWVELGLPERQFAAAFAGRLSRGEVARLRVRGWHLAELDAQRVLGSDAALVSEHLEREFRRHLLAQAG